MRRHLVLGYGLACYVLFLGVFAYAIGFVGGFVTPTRLDAPVGGAPSSSPLLGALVDLALVAVFGLQHSVMARPGFKRQWTRWIPASIERSTYVLATNLALGLLFWQWRPLGGIVWNVEAGWARGLAWSLYGAGWLTVLVATCLIHHFDLFGLRQTWLYIRGRPYRPLPFVTPGPYRFVRHPLYIGWILVLWATPTLTISHLLLAGSLTVYILAAIRWEERDLVKFHQAYAEYRQRVPMLIPRWPARTGHVATNAATD